MKKESINIKDMTPDGSCRGMQVEEEARPVAGQASELRFGVPYCKNVNNEA